MAKMLQFDDEALRSVLAGVKLLARAVSVTLGPKGRNVVIGKKFGSPLSTKDGVSVAREISLKNKFENMGAQLVKEVASRTADVAGDGTTTAIVLAYAIFSEGLKNVAAGANPMLVKRGIDKAVAALLTALDRLARPVSTHEEIKQIAAISANNDQSIGAMIAEAMERVGKDGIITADEAKGIETSLDVVEGMRFDKGYLSPYFVNQPEGMVCELANCRILIFDKKISSVKELVPVLERIVKAGATPLLLVAEEIDGEALATLVVNKLKGGLPVCAVKAPGFGDRRKALLQDMAVLTGATLISDEVGMKLEDVGPEVLGSAKRIKITKEETTIVEGGGSQKAIEVREREIRSQIENTHSDYDRQKLEERLASLVGGVAVIHVGAATETEMKEKKARVEDALHATRAAALGGIVPGGGVALLRAAQALAELKLEGDEELGKAILFSACFAPATAIGNNCGKAGNLIAEKIYEQSDAFGFNGLTGEFCDLYAAGVIDPLFVTKSALANAASVAGLLLTTAAMVTDQPQPKSVPAAGMDGGMGMGGMGRGGMGGMPGMM